MSNFVQVFYHAKGKWLLLIFDEDDVISTDWNRVRQVLMGSYEVSVFRAPVRGYITLNATRYRSNTFDAYKFICDYFHYISGGIFNRDIIAIKYMLDDLNCCRIVMFGKKRRYENIGINYSINHGRSLLAKAIS